MAFKSRIYYEYNKGIFSLFISKNSSIFQTYTHENKNFWL